MGLLGVQYCLWSDAALHHYHDGFDLEPAVSMIMPPSRRGIVPALLVSRQRLQLSFSNSSFVKVLLSRQQLVLLSLLPSSTSHHESDLEPCSTCSITALLQSCQQEAAESYWAFDPLVLSQQRVRLSLLPAWQFPYLLWSWAFSLSDGASGPPQQPCCFITDLLLDLQMKCLGLAPNSHAA